jgi:hypothetical protein
MRIWSNHKSNLNGHVRWHLCLHVTSIHNSTRTSYDTQRQQAPAERLILFCRRPKAQTFHIYSFIKLCSLCTVWEYTYVSMCRCVHNFLEPKFGRDQTDKTCSCSRGVAFCTESVYSAPRPAFRLDPNWSNERHTMHCFSPLGVWPLFSLTCRNWSKV